MILVLLHQCSHRVKHTSSGVFCYDGYMQKYKTVEDFLNDLDTDKRLQVNTLRDLILEVEPKLEERIKWNAPSYVKDGEDRITFNLMNRQGAVKLVLHMGATKKEDKKGKPVLDTTYGLGEWNSNMRVTLTFQNLTDINTKADKLKQLIADWLALKP
jgi:uncharacterized protein YdhG (YjbR/CyaY superfamily)